MTRFGLIVAAVGLVIWEIARRLDPSDRSWQKRGLRVFVGGLVIVWLGVLVYIGMLR